MRWGKVRWPYRKLDEVRVERSITDRVMTSSFSRRGIRKGEGRTKEEHDEKYRTCLKVNSEEYPKENREKQ